jgi:hypothetical protein
MSKLALIVLGWIVFGLPNFARADDYTLDPAPTEMIDRNIEKYQTPQDSEVCSLYLQNLRYFARRNEPLSCGQPIAPMLDKKIKKAEWENLDPEKYPDLYKEVIKEARFIKDPSQKELEWGWHEIREGGAVFRRLKFDLRGSPGVEAGSNRPLPEQEISIVQFGSDVTNPDNPDSTDRCHSGQGRIMSSSAVRHQLHFLIATKNLTHVFGELLDWSGRYLSNLWLINDRIYGESYDEKGDVKLTELRVTYPIRLEAVCLYHFKKTSHNSH